VEKKQADNNNQKSDPCTEPVERHFVGPVFRVSSIARVCVQGGRGGGRGARAMGIRVIRPISGSGETPDSGSEPGRPRGPAWLSVPQAASR